VKPTLYADSLEDAVYELISEKLANLKDCRRTVTTDNTAKINVLRNRLSEIAAAQEKLVDMMLQSGVESDMLKLLNERAKRMADEKQEILDRIESMESEQSEVIRVLHLTKRWKRASYEERRAVCNILIDQILMAEDGTMEVVWNI
jgi:hypothetical protein